MYPESEINRMMKELNEIGGIKINYKENIEFVLNLCNVTNRDEQFASRVMCDAMRETLLGPLLDAYKKFNKKHYIDPTFTVYAIENGCIAIALAKGQMVKLIGFEGIDMEFITGYVQALLDSHKATTK